MTRILTLDTLAAAPWALDRSVLAEWVGIAERGGMVAAVTRTPAAPRNQGVVQIIPVHGVIERRSSLFSELFGGTSVEGIRGALRAALADPEVRGIVLDIDSPGGAVAGVTELAEEIRAAREQKPIVAVADTTAASAAYWIGSQASRFLVTRSGQVGSIGVYGVHMDISRALEAEGVTATVISAGENKTAETEYAPLSDEGRAAIQARTNAYYAQFTGDVAKGRGVSVATVEDAYGKGSVLLAEDALAAGMVDGIGGIDVAFREVSRLARSMSAESTAVELAASDEPVPFRERVAALQADAESIVAHAQARAALRAKEGRPALSDPIVASLRATRDALSAVLPGEPAAPPPAVEPLPVVPVVPVAAAGPRFRSDDEWLRFLNTETN